MFRIMFIITDTIYKVIIKHFMKFALQIVVICAHHVARMKGKICSG